MNLVEDWRHPMTGRWAEWGARSCLVDKPVLSLGKSWRAVAISHTSCVSAPAITNQWQLKTPQQCDINHLHIYWHLKMKQALRQWTTSLFIIKHVHSAACLWWWQWTEQFDFSVSVIKDCNSLLLSKQTQSEYKHSLIFHIWHYAVTATKPVHRLQIRPALHNLGAPLSYPQATSGSMQ